MLHLSSPQNILYLGLNFIAPSLQTTPSSFSLLLHYRKKVSVQSTKHNGPNDWASRLPDPNYQATQRQPDDCF